MDRQRKRELRDLNARVWDGDKDVFAPSSSLDSSMKKNTAFIKRLRTAISNSSTAVFLQEIKTLSLHKYLSEIISACYEGLCKVKIPTEVPAAVEVFSALHQRFGPEEFTTYIGWLIGRGLSTPDKAQLKALAQDVREKEEKERIARHKVLLRVATELWLVGALRSLNDITRPEEAGKTKENTRMVGPSAQKTATTTAARSTTGTTDDEPFPLEVLKDLLSQDGQHVNLPLVVQLVKAFPWDLLGRKTGEDESIPDDDIPLVDSNMQQRFKNILSSYFEGATKHLVRDQTSLTHQSKRNAEAYVRSGEIFEDRQSNFEKQIKSQDKFVANMQVLAEALNTDMPELKEKESTTAATDGNIGLVKTGEYLKGQSDGAGIWEDEEERRFYENTIDLKDRVPSILLEEPKKKKTEDEQVGKRVEDKTANGSAEETEKVVSKSAEDQSTSIANKTVGAQVDSILVRIPEAISKEMMDEIAIDFCFVNSKASRNRLIKTVQEPPKGRSDLLPLYARLVTTLGKYMPDISQGLVSHLDEEFRSLQRRKQKDSLGGVRTSNIRYLAELTKFGLVPEHVIFHCLKVSLDEFSRMNIEIICNLLDNCGRFLLRTSETAPRMKSFLETLQRKKAAQHLAPQERMLIENSIYYVNPPERAAIEPKERTPIDLFVRKLVYVDLNKRNLDKVSKQIRKLHWEEDEVVEILRKIFVKPYNIKYSNIHFLAIILGSLNRYHQDFSVQIIDEVMENITFGLELNEFKYNQRRIAEVKYLGELYVYRMVDSSIVFQTLWRIATFGHADWTNPNAINPLDAPDDFFRIRLICVLLDTCGSYFEKGATKKKLDMFLKFFQFYFRLKDPMPMDVWFLVNDTFSLLRPQWTIATTLEEAGNEFASALKEESKNGSAPQNPAHPTEQDDQDDQDGEQDAGGRGSSDAADGESSEDEVEMEENQLAGSNTESDDESEDEEEEIIVVKRPEDERDPEVDAEFDRELAKMMAESLETRKTERRQMHDVVLPMRRAPLKDATTTSFDSGDEAPLPQQQPSTIKFSLLSKKGNRAQTRAIDLPADSNFAIAMRSQQEAEKAEQQRIKELVLNYDLQKNEEDDENNANGDYHKFSYIPHVEPNFNRINPYRRRQTRWGTSSSKVEEATGLSFENNPRVERRAALMFQADALADNKDKKTFKADILRDSKGSTSLAMSDRHHNTNATRDTSVRGAGGHHASYDTSNKTRRSGDGSSGSAGRRGQARKLQMSDVNWT